jgi:quercetin dioxygenase-like cupin family protein
MDKSNNLRSLNRYITTHNPQGEAIFSAKIEETNKMRLLPDATASFGLAYATKAFPVNINDDKDIDVYKHYLNEPPGLTISNGSVLRFVDIAPGFTSAMHRTVSLDYGVVIEGEVELLLNSGERKSLKRGDVAIQRGTMHAWRNTSSNSWARMMYVLLPCDPLEVGGEKLGEDLETMQGVRSSD